MNEYREEFEELRSLQSYKAETWFGKRQDLVEKYAWAVPTEETVEHLCSYDCVLEVGAGSGYWASLVRDSGGNISPYDIDPPVDMWTDVRKNPEDNTERIVRASPAECLLLCWPPVSSPLANRVLDWFEGEHVCYVGEGAGGCTADIAFHEQLEREWEQVEWFEIPSYYGVRDDFFHFKRKT